MAASTMSNSGSVQRTFMILEFLNSSSRGWNISELSRKLRSPKSTTHVLVSTLDKLGYIKNRPSPSTFSAQAQNVRPGAQRHYRRRRCPRRPFRISVI